MALDMAMEAMVDTTDMARGVLMLWPNLKLTPTCTDMEDMEDTAMEAMEAMVATMDMARGVLMPSLTPTCTMEDMEDMAMAMEAMVDTMDMANRRRLQLMSLPNMSMTFSTCPGPSRSGLCFLQQLNTYVRLFSLVCSTKTKL